MQCWELWPVLVKIQAVINYRCNCCWLVTSGQWVINFCPQFLVLKIQQHSICSLQLILTTLFFYCSSQDWQSVLMSTITVEWFLVSSTLFRFFFMNFKLLHLVKCIFQTLESLLVIGRGKISLHWGKIIQQENVVLCMQVGKQSKSVICGYVKEFFTCTIGIMLQWVLKAF